MTQTADRAIDLALTQDQQLLAGSVEKFLAGEIPPLKLRDIVERPELPRDLWRDFSALGVHGLLIAEQQGGAGLGLSDLVVVAEKCGAAVLPLPYLSHAMAALALGLSQNKAARKYLAALAVGEKIASVGFLDRETDEVAWVERADVADVIVVVGPGDTITVLDRATAKFELRSENSADLSRPCFAVRMPEVPRLPLSPGADQRIRDAWRILQAADAWGIGHRFLYSARDYALTRETFGRKIGEYQSIKHPLADMVTVHAFAQMSLRHAARLWDGMDGECGDMARLVKAHITHEVVGMARQCIEIMGAYGFTWEGGDHIWFKRAMFAEVHLGSPAALRREIADARGWNDPKQDRTLTRVWRRKL